jgi:DNA-binding protein HU-beta
MATAKTVTLKQIAASISDELELSKRQTSAVLELAMQHVADNLKQRNRVRISGIGALVVRDRAERQGRNPATGETITIKASRKVAFRVAKELKEAV